MTAVDGFDQAGDLRTAAQTRANCGHACLELGAYAEAKSFLVSALREAEASGTASLLAVAKNNLGMALGYLGEIPEAIAHEQAAIDAYHELGDERLEAASRVYLATILEIGGRYVEAEREARRATLLLATVPPLAPIAISKLADLLRLQGHVDEAISTAEEAARALERAGRVEGDGSMVHLALAEALACANRMAEARVALSMARAELDRQAGKIPDPAWRARFLGSIPHHARILALSAQWS